MGMIALVDAFLRRPRGGVQASIAEVDPGGGAAISAPHFGSPGEDAVPLPGDFTILVTLTQNGAAAAVGYADTVNEPKAGPGEVRRYARDSGGAVVCSIWLKADGSIVGENANGVFELKTDGTFEANGAKMLVDGDVVTSDGKSLRNHVHIITGGSSAPGPTAPPT